MFKISLENLDKVFEKIASSSSLYLPVDTDNGRAEYKKWQDGVKYSTALNTAKSPKDFFFPQTEDLMAFKVDGKTIEIKDIRTESEDFVIFGVRACDVKSFDVLDKVFLAEPKDSYYASRRAHGTIISMACTKPAESCFCSTFGIDPATPAGDISCYMTDDSVYMSANTEKGESLIKSLGGLVSECGKEAVDKQKKLIGERMKKLPLASLSTEKFGAGKTDEFFNAPEWKELSEACLGCGTCTFVCPTCQCYDIKDFNGNDGVTRYRCWDSCMYSDFTKMSAGQPRLTQVERFRQRFMHKLVYFPENNNGMFSCVGCGRCVVRCPISMNIVKVMKNVGGNK